MKVQTCNEKPFMYLVFWLKQKILWLIFSINPHFILSFQVYKHWFSILQMFREKGPFGKGEIPSLDQNHVKQ